jgi:hypothetical protein
MRYIFLDTFVLEQLTRNYYSQLEQYLTQNKLHIIISSLQLMEYYSPIIQQGDRTNRAIQLLASHPFVIVNQEDIFSKEEEAYPSILTALPYRLESVEVMRHLTMEERNKLLFQMLHEGIPGTDFDLKRWANNHKESKLDWPKCAEAIIQNAEVKGSLKPKNRFLQSLDLRFCSRIREVIERLDDPSKHDAQFKRYFEKLAGMRARMDTWRMRGIHLSSLIFWYDYVVAKKKIKVSDEGDLFHSMIFPYCSIVITDNSKVDCIEKIQKKENRYKEVQFLKIKDFITILST